MDRIQPQITENRLPAGPSALIEAVSELKPVILVAHSTGGMYALFTPEIEPFLGGLILLDSAPDAKWQIAFAEAQKKFPIPGLKTLHERYSKEPSNKTLKALTVAAAPYLFTEKGMDRGLEMLNTLFYSYESCQWSEEHFDSTYRAKWVPKTIPTLILSGECDLLTPLRLFKEATQFHRDNISFKSIRNAGHFPWMDNPTEVVAAFQEYYRGFL